MSESVGRPDDPRLAPYAHVGDAGWLRDQGLFVAEGRLVVERLLDTGGYDVQSILVTPAAERALAACLASVAAPVLVCGQEVLNGVTGFNFHRGCLALARRPALPRPDAWPARDGLVLALEGVGNPDNVGGLFRAAAALGASGVLIGPGTADPLYRKAMRTSMGAVLKLPWAMGLPWPETLDRMRKAGYRIVALTPASGAVPLRRFAESRHSRIVLLAGAEGGGLSSEALAAADDLVRIPIADAVDSLNVTVAAAIALHVLSPNLEG